MKYLIMLALLLLMGCEAGIDHTPTVDGIHVRCMGGVTYYSIHYKLAPAYQKSETPKLILCEED